MQNTWDDNLSTGNPVIDGQHKELFRRLNLLLIACRQGDGPQAIAQAIHFLETHMVEHFGHEEKLMADAGFPDRTIHEQEHREFFGHFMRVRKMFQTQGSDYSLVVDTIKTVVGWAANHIMVKDKALCRFLREQAKSAKKTAVDIP
jgi:hemerythrin